MSDGSAGLATIPELDPAEFGRWSRGNGIDIPDDVAVTRVGIGQSNLTYLLTAGDVRWVLRRPPVGNLLASAHDVVREARILSALADTPVPVPRIHGVCTDTAVAPAPLVVMEFVEAVALDNLPAAEALTVEQRRSVGKSMIDTLATIHEVDLEAVGLSDLASHKPYAARQLKRWSSQWEKSRTRDIPAVDDLTRRFLAHAPEQHETRLVHGDFHIRNVMIDPAAASVRAVLDWELSTLGDPLADIGSTLAYWPAPGGPQLSAVPVELLDGFPDRATLAADYIERTGRDPQALAYWHALGLWKVAIIAQGILKRVEDNASNRAAGGVPTTTVVDTLVEMAQSVAGEAGI
ncbi:phosphotransferase family protein [Gordonia pseudamarae]|uniref:phosphotransferase family protein n=1 Tax=Gordonia pseudamarae TaxID=2831662 RepID=UPI003899667A